MSSPFMMDEAQQAGHVSTFQDLVAQTMANNNHFKSTAETAMVANQGRMSQAFQVWMEELVTHATVNNQKLEAISEALGFGIKSTAGADESNAAPFGTGQLA
jgi:hypothetical protein